MTIEQTILAALEADATVGAKVTRFLLDTAIDDWDLPYISAFQIDEVPAIAGDAATVGTHHSTQIDLWQARGAEDDTLADEVRAVINGARFGLAGYARTAWVQTTRLAEGGDDGQPDVIHHAVTVTTPRTI